MLLVISSQNGEIVLFSQPHYNLIFCFFEEAWAIYMNPTELRKSDMNINKQVFYIILSFLSTEVYH